MESWRGVGLGRGYSEPAARKIWTCAAGAQPCFCQRTRRLLVSPPSAVDGVENWAVWYTAESHPSGPGGTD